MGQSIAVAIAATPTGLLVQVPGPQGVVTFTFTLGVPALEDLEGVLREALVRPQSDLLALYPAREGSLAFTRGDEGEVLLEGHQEDLGTLGLTLDYPAQVGLLQALQQR